MLTSRSHNPRPVRRTVQRLRGQGLVSGPPNLSRSRRSIPLPESSREALLSHSVRQKDERWRRKGHGEVTELTNVPLP